MSPKNDLLNFDQPQGDSPKAAANSPKSKKNSLGWANDHLDVLEEQDPNKIIPEGQPPQNSDFLFLEDKTSYTEGIDSSEFRIMTLLASVTYYKGLVE
jgi:hypothetical protein